MSDQRAFLVPFSHLDLFWAGEQQECLSRGSRILSRALARCRQQPDFRFLVEDVVFLEYFLRNHPECRAELKDRVRDGQIEIGPKWAGIHQNIQLGEDLVRNVLYGTAYTRRELDCASTVMHLGDLPGWTPQYPQIAAGLGLRSIVSTRCGPRNTPLFHWRAPDGTQILTWYARHGYHWAWSQHFERAEADMGEMAEQLGRLAERTPGPVLVHWGIDLVLPPEDLPGRVAAWNARYPIPLCAFR